MVQSGLAASEQRGPRLGAVLSLTCHGAAVAIMIALGRVPLRSPPSKTVLITVVQPAVSSEPPSAPPSEFRTAAARPARGRDTRARTQRELAERAQVAPVTVRSLPGVRISYDDAASSAMPGPTTIDVVGGGRSSIASIPLANGIATIDIPPPPVSLARSPRPKHDYSKLRIPGASKFAGEIVKLELTIDVRGQVRRVQLLQGVNRELDRKTIALVRTFEYHPALDAAGVAMEGTSRWDVQIVQDEDADMFDTAREHIHR
jgi:hypothetical protein